MPLISPDTLDSLRHSHVRTFFGRDTLGRLGAVAIDLGATRVLLVTDAGIVRAGHADRAAELMRGAGLEVTVYDGARENPTTRDVDAGVRVSRERGIDLIVGLGGGSSMDCAKGINFLLTNGGRMEDYRGIGKAKMPMLPLICVPTTAGTGSEAQSFALITDPQTHQKMACGDEKALPRVALLDPALTATVPFNVAAATGIDAIAHAIETAGCIRRNAISRELSVAAWRLLDPAFEALMRTRDVSPAPANSKAKAAAPSTDQGDADERSDLLAAMLLGAHFAGAAIEKSMLGAAHACANPLTALFNITHGVAVGVMLPHVIRFNAGAGISADAPENDEDPYADLWWPAASGAEALARRIEFHLEASGLPRRLRDLGVTDTAYTELAALAQSQWTARFNPRPLDADACRQLYRAAM